MIANSGRNTLNKLLARSVAPQWGIGIGNGGSDPVYLTPIASGPNDTDLKKLVYFSPSIDVMTDVTPPESDFPRIFVQHTFFARNVAPTGVAITFIDELGVFVKDPDTGLYSLVDRQPFDRIQFIVPATGASVSRDFETIQHTFGCM